jgi:group I intron endonuclease
LKRAMTLNKNNMHYQRVVAKHGVDGITVLWKEFETEKDALEDEINMISEFRALGFNLCNKTDGGEGITGLSHSDKTRQKMSASKKGKPYKLRGEKSPRYGTKHTEEELLKMSNKLSGKNHPLYGKNHSAETRRKMAKSHTGKTVSEETRAKISATMKQTLARKSSITFEPKGN